MAPQLKQSDYEFFATLKDGIHLRKIIDTVKEFMNESSVQVSETGLTIEGMDNSHVSLLQMKWNPEGFEYYKCTKPMQLGIHFETMSKVVRLQDQEKKISLAKLPDQEVLRVIYGSPDSSSFFDIKLLDVEFDALDVASPDDCVGTEFAIKSEALSHVINTFSAFGDTMRIRVMKDGIKMWVNSDVAVAGRYMKENSSVTGLYKMTKFITTVEEDYNLKYMGVFIKAATLTDMIKIKCVADEPMMVTFPIGTMQCGRLTFFLAPKNTNKDAGMDDE